MDILNEGISQYIAGVYHHSQNLRTNDFRVWCIDNLTLLVPDRDFIWSIIQNEGHKTNFCKSSYCYQAKGSTLTHVLSLPDSENIPLDDYQVEIINFILPHLAVGFRFNLLSNFYIKGKEVNNYLGIFDNSGMVLDKDNNVVSMLQSKGIFLNNVINTIKNNNQEVFVYSGVVFIVSEKESYKIVRIYFPGSSFNILSSKELVVCYQVGCSLSNEEIAKSMSISIKTVENHLSSIYKKLNIVSRAVLVSKINEESRYSLLNNQNYF
ncbi:putative regulator [Vibrio nigripulchritudo MADA3029]|uniref:helix-turn-helix transcriptional regulator n=1 Tax=Vibrio nigripulchritudo TaxID=28173 RepID=UPI0003B1828E|nr:LuxR C-terminal-related transcriptional regulator [Vibrio nigripulchritudo]CCN45970.1 putative regulator [Vibrio nigripulchritudo MADA3020]CCN55238.1 putative regulator [Vibrio nigripulchritudo MADA3021]CCN62359.1 putative regulator [Vibrio nigripulchritudo MADA3029]